jgi:hypothetical protein
VFNLKVILSWKFLRPSKPGFEKPVTEDKYKKPIFIRLLGALFMRTTAENSD